MTPAAHPIPYYGWLGAKQREADDLTGIWGLHRGGPWVAAAPISPTGSRPAVDIAILLTTGGGEARGMNLYYAHSAVGIQLVYPESSLAVSTLDDAALGESWARLPGDERQRLEDDFFQGVLRFLSDRGDARFIADLPFKEDMLRLRNAAESQGVDISVERSVLSGPLVSELISPLVATNPVELEVVVGGSPRLDLDDGWTGVRVRLTDKELQALSRMLAKD
jgi:hypothetical protein